MNFFTAFKNYITLFSDKNQDFNLNKFNFTTWA